MVINGKKSYPGEDACQLGEILIRAAGEVPNELALRFLDETFTYSEMFEKSRRYASYLKENGLQLNDRVALILENRPEFFFAFFGTLFKGGVVVTISPKSTVERIVEIIKHSDSECAVVSDELYERIGEELESRLGGSVRFVKLSDVNSEPCSSDEIVKAGDASLPAFLQYTSATTGSSKGVIISHKAVLENIKGISFHLGVRRNYDRVSSFMPLYHDMGLVGFGLMPIYAGVPLFLHQQDIRCLFGWLDEFREKKTTISGASNTILYLTRRVVSDPERYDLSSLRAIVVGSEPIYYDTVANFEKDYNVPGVVLPAYGLAEATLCVTISKIGAKLKADQSNTVSCGTAMDGVEVKIDGAKKDGDVGEILIKSPAVMSGYYKNSEESKDSITEGYLKTGDLGYLNSYGELFVIGRKKNIIIRNGENIFPAEIEAVAVKMRNVRAAAIFGLPSSERNGYEDIVLVVEVDSGRSINNLQLLEEVQEEIIEVTRKSCSYQPDRIIFVEPMLIPFSPNGKLQHMKLKNMFEAGEINDKKTVELAEMRKK